MEPRNFVEFHCHLDDAVYGNDRAQVIEACFTAGLKRLVTVADPYEEDSLQVTRDLLDAGSDVFATVGAHPHRADDYSAEIEARILAFSEHPRVIAIGEAGLDFFHNLSQPDHQRRVFLRQVALARETGHPLVVHSRSAEAEALALLTRERFPFPVAFHCYTGPAATARDIIAAGHFISFSGILTFKNSMELRAIAAETPLDRLFTETDSPYLSPEPFRGRPNHPSRVVLVARALAGIRDIPVEELNRHIDMNFRRFFSVT